MSLPSIDALLSFGVFIGYRSLVTTSLSGIAKREIFQNTTTIKIIKTTPFLELLGKGFQPYSLKYLTTTPVQLASFRAASSIVPLQMDPAARGAMIGFLSSGIETSVNNIWNVFATRFIQGQGWGIAKEEGVSLLTRGLLPVLMHRISSSVIFWSIYEKLHKKENPYHPGLNGIIAGTVQVCFTSPFYIATTLRQGKNPPQENLLLLFKKITKQEGVVKGLFFRGLVPRLCLSWLTSGPLMSLIEKYNIVSR